MRTRVIALLLAALFFSTTIQGATQTHRGTNLPPHPNPLMQSPATIATIKVTSAQNFRANKVTVVWRMKPNTIATQSGPVVVPSLLARGEEFTLQLVDPSGNVWPISRPVMYSTLLGVHDTSIKVSEIGTLAAVAQDEPSIDLSELANALDGVVVNPDVLNQPTVNVGDLALGVSLVGPQLDQHGYIRYGDNGQPETMRTPCAQATWHRSAQRGGIFPVCDIEDIRAFRASYEDSVDFSARSRTVVFEFPREVSTYGVWQLVAVDTRPLEHDLISLGMIPLNSSGGLIQPVSSEPLQLPSARFPRMQFDTAGVVFEGEARPLPDTGPRTERFRNELADPVSALTEFVDPAVMETLNPNIPDVSVIGDMPSTSSVLTAGIEAMMARRAREGANRIVMSGLRLQKLTLDAEIQYIGQAPRPTVSLVLVHPSGRQRVLEQEFEDGEHSWTIQRRAGLPLRRWFNQPIDGTWRVVLRNPASEDVSRDFSFEMEATVTGPGTDFFIVQEFDEPEVASNGEVKRFTFQISQSRPIRKIWFRAFTDNFIGFKHEVSLLTPNGRRIESCLSTSPDGPCIEVGSDGIGKIVNTGDEIAPQGTWRVDWRVLKAEDLLSEQTNGGIGGGVCEVADLQANNDPMGSAQGFRQDNPLGVSAPQFNQAWLLSRNEVRLGGFLVGFGETPPDKFLMQHSFLDKAEDGVWNKPWFERFAFSRGFWDHMKLARELRERHLPGDYEAFFDQTIGLMQRRQLNRLAVFQGAGVGGFLVDRLLEGQNTLEDLRAFDAYKTGFSDWGLESIVASMEERNAIAGITGITSSVPFRMGNDMSFYMHGGNEDLHLGQLYTAFVTTAGGTGFVAGGACSAVITIGTAGAGTVPSAPGCAAFGLVSGIMAGTGRVAYDVYRHYDQQDDDGDSSGGTDTGPDGNSSNGNGEDDTDEDDSGPVVNTTYETLDHGTLTFRNKVMTGADEDGTYHFNGRKYDCQDGSCTDVGESDLEVPEGEYYKELEENEMEFTEEEVNNTGTEDDEDEETESECPPDLLDGCGQVPPQGWFQQHIATSQSPIDPFIAHWGNFAPYINCGPDGCMEGSIPETSLGSQGLDPWVNCDADGVTCGADEFGKACTSFNWADTFTDPVPDGGPGIGGPDDPEGPDCTDGSNPCTDPGG